MFSYIELHIKYVKQYRFLFCFAYKLANLFCLCLQNSYIIIGN